MTAPRTGAVEIVELTPAHLDAVLEHEREMFGPEAWTRSGYRGELADVRTRRYLALQDPDGRLLGWGGVMVVGDSAELLTVGIVPAARRAGLARRLLAALVEQAVARGAREMFLEVRVDNLAAITLYESEGFRRLGFRRGYYDAGRVDALTMRRALRSRLASGAGLPAADDTAPGGAP